MKLLALIADTLREIYARKVILGIVLIEVVALVITWRVLYSDGMQESYRERARLGAAGTAGQLPTNDSADAFSRRIETDDSVLAELAEADTSFDFDTTSILADGDLAGDGDELDTPSPDGILSAPGRGGPAILREVVKAQMAAYAAAIVAATIFLGIFATAGIIPSLMEKGTIDLILSKPLPRWQILFGRAAGGIGAVAVNLLLFSVGIWALYGGASGIWYAPFIGATVGIGMFTFLVVYSAILLLNVITESWVLPMSLAYIHIVILSNFLSTRESTLYMFIESEALRSMIDGLYWILPQVNDLVAEVPTAIFAGGVASWSPFIQGAIFTTVMLGLAAWKFARKDF